MDTTTAPHAASVARQKRHEVDARVERAARMDRHRTSYYLAAIAEEKRYAGRDVELAVYRDRAAKARLELERARVDQREAYNGRGAMAGDLALADAISERQAARVRLAELVGATDYAGLVDALAARGLELA